MPNVITLDMNTPSVQYLCKKDKRLAKVISMVGPITYVPYCDDPYAFLIHEIIEQMLSVKVGQIIYGRLETLCNGSITPETIMELSDEELRSIGTANSKVNFIRSVTNAVMSRELDFSQLNNLSDSEAMSRLMSIRGIGIWTSKMYLMFVMDRPNILPVEDVAFLQAYQWLYKTDDRNKDSVINRCKKWSPYSTTASRYLYRALDMGFTKNEFHLYKED